MIIDCHVHQNSYAVIPGDPGGLQVRIARRVGVDRMCLSLGTSRAGIRDDTIRGPQIMAHHNDEVFQAWERYPDCFIPFCYLNPNYLPESLEEIDRCVVEGPFAGLKTIIDLFCDHPNYDPICERAAELGVPVLQHTWIKATGNYPGESEPWRLLALARRNPTTTFIAAHTGGNWEIGIKTFADQENIIADICGGDPEMGYVEMAVREMGAERVVYGSDAPGRSFASQLAKVTGADISDEHKAQILGGNMQRILNLEP